MDIKQYYRYYIGQDVYIFPTDTITDGWLADKIKNHPTLQCKFELTDKNLSSVLDDEYFLILRRLEDITEEECIEMYNVEYNDSNPDAAKVRLVKHWINPLQICLTPKQLHYLLQKGFWLFGNEAFDKNLIIDKKTLKQ